MTLVRGRVLHAVRDHLVLVLPGGQVHEVSIQPGETSPAPGDLVELAQGTIRLIHAHPRGEYPQPGTDEMRFADPERWNRFRRRAELLAQTRDCFRTRGFLEVETPSVVPCPGTDLHIDPTPVLQRQSEGAEAAERFLITSPEHHMKRLLAGGAPPIVQIGRVYRDGEYGQHHRPEFTLVEWYRPWEEPSAVMADCEVWLRTLNGQDKVVYQGHSLDLAPPWPQIRFLDALSVRGGIREPERLTAEEQLRALVETVEPGLGRERPEFLTHYPITMASLARPNADDPSVSDRFELFAGGLELGNGFGELTDAQEQRRRFQADNAHRKAAGKPELPLDDAFLSALETGMPPSSGIAVGFDRVVMLLSDATDIDEVLTF